MNSKIELDHEFEQKDDEAFTRQFRRDFTICIGIGLLGSIGLITFVAHADKIDRIIGEFLKLLFI